MKLTRQKLRGLILETINESFDKGIMTTGFFGRMRGVSEDDIENFMAQFGNKLYDAYGYINEVDVLLKNIRDVIGHPSVLSGSKKDFYVFAKRALDEAQNINYIPEIFSDYFKIAFGESANVYFESFNNAISALRDKVFENQAEEKKAGEYNARLKRDQEVKNAYYEREAMIKNMSFEKQKEYVMQYIRNNTENIILRQDLLSVFADRYVYPEEVKAHFEDFGQDYDEILNHIIANERIPLK